MAVSWTAHRFSGGVLAIDVANTVVLRGDTARSFDRLDDSAEFARFAAAASGFRTAELGGRQLCAADPGVARRVVSIREATDSLFRNAVLNGATAAFDLSRLLLACADGFAAHQGALACQERPFGDPSTPIALDAALAVSALSLLPERQARRIRICANCRWLFLDASRNGSRLWCDMAVCGNRQKARRHYQRRNKGEGQEGHV